MPATAVDAPPALRVPAVVACEQVAEGSSTRGASTPTAIAAGSRATAAALDAGTLRVTCADGLEAVRPSAWLRAAGDGRDAIDVVLRPCGSAVTVTWRDGRRARFGVSTLRG